MTENSFPPFVAEKLKYYVYRLVDPRNGRTFYVGKGQGNRVFQHIQQELEESDENLKLKTISQIQNLNLEVGHVIHRHGMDENTALAVESALIDLIPGLNNIQGGVGNSTFGSMHVAEILQLYAAKVAVFTHRAILIKVGHSGLDLPLYEATRFAWKLDLKRAQQAQLVLPVQRGLIVDAYEPTKWLKATAENFVGRETVEGRYGFEGKQASPEILKNYCNHRIPDSYCKRGSANPIRYTW